MKTTNYLGIMSIKWGLGFYNSEANIYTKNPLLKHLCHWYLKLRGFKPVHVSSDVHVIPWGSKQMHKINKCGVRVVRVLAKLFEFANKCESLRLKALFNLSLVDLHGSQRTYRHGIK